MSVTTLTGIYSATQKVAAGNTAVVTGAIKVSHGPGVYINSGGLDNQGYILGSGSLGPGIFGVSANVTNSGTIIGNLTGVWLEAASTLTNSSTIIGDGAFADGVEGLGYGTISNSGVIVGDTGIILNSSGTHSSQIVNSGVIYGPVEIANVGSYGNANDTGTIINTGTILADTKRWAVAEAGTGNEVTLGGLVSVSGSSGFPPNYAVFMEGMINGTLAANATNELTLLHGVTLDGAIQCGGYGHNAVTLTGSTGTAPDTVTLDAFGETISDVTISIDTSAPWVLDIKGTVASITGYNAADTLVLQGASYTAGSFISGTGLVLGAETIGITGSFTTEDFTVTTDGANTTITTDVAAPCFCPGTRIRMPSGQVAVEKLSVGDLVVTAHHGPQPIRWIGRRAYEGRFIAGNHLALPVKLRRHALGLNVPARDLYVSPGHALAEGGVLVNAWRFINGVSITQAERVERVEYFHIELDRHAVIFAENTPVESFLDNGCRAQFHNAAEAPAAPALKPCLPVIEEGYYLRLLQTRIAARAGVGLVPHAIGPLRGNIDQAGPFLCGWAQDEASPETPVELELVCNGQVLLRFLANRYRVDLRRAGLGSGCHAFEMMMPPLAGPFLLRRAQDGALLGTREALAA